VLAAALAGARASDKDGLTSEAAAPTPTSCANLRREIADLFIIESLPIWW
jgi:hypothetical protein